MIQSSDQKDPLVIVNLQDVFSADSTSSDRILLKQSYQIPESCWQNWLSTWLKLLEPPIIDREICEVTLRFTGDREIQQLNAKYRNFDRPTDVLAFASLEADLQRPPIADFLDEPLYLGDIIISIETASDRAKQLKRSLIEEVIWLAAHGFLHLLGWDHPDEQSLNEMIFQQETLLKIESLKNYLGEINYRETNKSRATYPSYRTF